MDDNGQYTYGDGYVEVSMIEGSSHRVSLIDYARVLDAIHSNAKWVNITNVTGAATTVRVDRIDEVTLWDADALAELDRMNAYEHKQHESPSWMDND